MREQSVLLKKIKDSKLNASRRIGTVPDFLFCCLESLKSFCGQLKD